MSNKVIVALDKDDTLVATGQYILNGLIAYANREENQTVKNYLDRNSHLSTMLHPQWMKDITWNEIIEPGIYMLEADPTALVYRDRLLERLADLRDHFLPAGSMDIVVCSHRGFHKKGQEYTETWLSELNLLGEFDAIHMLDAKETPNKVEFLKEQYPGAKIVLIDDNPLSDVHKVHPYMEELLIVDVEHSLPGYVNQTKYTDPTQVIGMIENYLKE